MKAVVILFIMMAIIPMVSADIQIGGIIDSGVINLQTPPPPLNITTLIGNLTLGDLLDVDVPAPLAFEVLTFNSSSGMWESISPQGQSKDTASIYLSNDSATIFFNDTQLNITIDDRERLMEAIGPYLFNNSLNIFFNDTLLNETIDNRDKLKDTVGPYLFNDSVAIFFNDTLLNITIDDRDKLKDTLGPYLSNDSLTIFFNDTLLNITIDDRDKLMDAIGPYLSNDSLNIFFNETLLNITISRNRNLTNIALTNQSNTFNGNQTILGNLTVSSIFATFFNWIVDPLYLIFDGFTLSINETNLNNTIDNRDKLKDTVGPYLSNDSLTIFFNDTLLNITIDDRDKLMDAIGPYLFNDSLSIFFNDTFLNLTIDNRDKLKDTDSIYLFNDSLTIFVNETQLNTTIDSIINETLSGNINIGGNLTGTFFFGGMEQTNISGIIIEIPGLNVPVNITNMTQATEINGFIFRTTHELVAERPGIYKADYSISFTGGSNEQYRFDLNKNAESILGSTAIGTIPSGGSVMGLSGTTLVQLSANDTITLSVQQDSTPIKDITYFSASVNLIRVGN